MSNLNKSSFVPLSVILFSIANVHAATCTYDNRLYECVPPIREGLQNPHPVARVTGAASPDEGRSRP
jgi:hypothetical protein